MQYEPLFDDKSDPERLTWIFTECLLKRKRYEMTKLLLVLKVWYNINRFAQFRIVTLKTHGGIHARPIQLRTTSTQCTLPKIQKAILAQMERTNFKGSNKKQIKIQKKCQK